MKKTWLLMPFLTATTVAGSNPRTIPCETKTYDAAQHTLTIVCPPNSIFSPIRLELTVAEINGGTWQDVDVEPLRPIEMMAAESEGVVLRLPHQAGAHRWIAWRGFRRVVRIIVRRDSLTSARAQQPLN